MELLKFEGGLWWTWFRDSTVISGSVGVLLCNEALGTSSPVTVGGEAVQVGLADASQSCQ